MIANPPIDSLIYMFNHYKKLADDCWDMYNNLADYYTMYDYYMGYAENYEQAILVRL